MFSKRRDAALEHGSAPERHELLRHRAARPCPSSTGNDNYSDGHIQVIVAKAGVVNAGSVVVNLGRHNLMDPR